MNVVFLFWGLIQIFYCAVWFGLCRINASVNEELPVFLDYRSLRTFWDIIGWISPFSITIEVLTSTPGSTDLLDNSPLGNKFMAKKKKKLQHFILAVLLNMMTQNEIA